MIVDMVRSSPRQTFVAYPLVLLAFEWLRQGGRPRMGARFAPLLAWGFLQYWLVGRYRAAQGGGGPGIENRPVRLLTDGPYAYTRNPMYLGHLLFTAGLVLTLRSWLGALLLAERVARFNRRVVTDEALLQEQFGDEYRAYVRRVPRWVPRVP